MLTYTALGRPDTVRAYLQDFRNHADADELMLAHHADSTYGRWRSMDLLGEIQVPAGYRFLIRCITIIGMRTQLRARSSVTLGALAAAALVLGFGAPAYGHAIIELNGKDAVAGKNSLMTLEVQHGCIDGAQDTIQVQAFVGKPWRTFIPKAVAGWTSTSAKQANGGLTITWVKQGTPAAFGAPVYFPISIGWPTKPGIYGMSVLQICPSTSTYWNDPFGPATANKPSPPLTPLAQVKVNVT